MLLTLATAGGAERLVAVSNVVLVSHANNDGDSFHCRAGRSNITVRLYDVDCAEIKPTTPERHRLQVEFFGCDGAQLRHAGVVASNFTAKALSRPFTLLTRWRHSYGGERVLAYAIAADGRDLGGLLVSNRLARPHGGRYNPPK